MPIGVIGGAATLTKEQTQFNKLIAGMAMGDRVRRQFTPDSERRARDAGADAPILSITDQPA